MIYIALRPTTLWLFLKATWLKQLFNCQQMHQSKRCFFISHLTVRKIAAKWKNSIIELTNWNVWNFQKMLNFSSTTFQLHIFCSYFYLYIVKIISGYVFILNYLEIAIFEVHMIQVLVYAPGLCQKFWRICYSRKLGTVINTISYFTICNFKFEYATCTATADQLHFDCRILTYFCYLASHNKAKTFMKSHLSFYPYSITSFELLHTI